MYTKKEKSGVTKGKDQSVLSVVLGEKRRGPLLTGALRHRVGDRSCRAPKQREV